MFHPHKRLLKLTNYMKPIKFEALLKNTIWGGNDINHLKQLPEGTKAVGESWEISGVPGNETIVTAGDDLGATLPALIRNLPPAHQVYLGRTAS